MKIYGGVEVHLHASLTSALDGDQRPVSRPGLFNIGASPIE
jgi:hypothetical protein